jgi:hypothetical protein
MLLCGLLQVKSGYVLELSDQKAQCFLVLIALKWFLPASIHIFAVVPNLVPRADSFSIAMRSWSS